MKREKILLSVVVPCYNIEQHINSCYNSLNNQTFKNFEVIFVNDGSKDNTLNIIKKICAKHKQFSYINQKNKGVSSARNEGLKKAKGEYIYFLDGDDWIHPETFKYFKEKSIKNSDLFCFKYKIIIKNKQITKENSLEEGLYNPDFFLEQFFDRKINLHICSCIFKKSFLVNHEIYFANGFKYGEDREFIVKSLALSKKIYFINQFFFNYIIREGSAMSRMSKNRLDSLILAINLKKFFNDKKKSENLKLLLNNYVSDQYLHLLKEIFKSKSFYLYKDLRRYKGHLKYTKLRKNLFGIVRYLSAKILWFF